MTKTKTLLKGLVGATALTALSSGTAFAAGTEAGTLVSNTFTLDYNVGTTPQPPVTGDTPTTFVVDRLIDVNVAANTGTSVAPGSTDQPLAFTLTNEGNDDQGYVLTPGNVVSGDDFDATNLSVFYVIDANGDGINNDGAPVAYNGTSTPDIAPDQIVFVTIEGDIPGAAGEGETSNITLLAETAVTGGSGAVKAVEIFAEVPNATNDCAIIPGTPAAQTNDGNDQYAIPGACVEYTITATNSGAATATAIDIEDTLPANLTFVAASASGFSTAGTFSTLPTANQNCSTTPCVVVYDGAELTDGSTTPTVGTVTIRALINSDATENTVP